MKYIETNETRAIEKKFSLLFKRRGSLNEEYKKAESLPNIHDRVACRTRIRETLDALDRIEHKLNIQFNKHAID